VITAGVDLAAQPERTAVATIKWTAGRAVIEDVVCRADDEGPPPAGEAGRQNRDRLPVRLAGCLRQFRDLPSCRSPDHPCTRARLAPQPHDAPDRPLRPRAAAPDRAERLSGPDRACGPSVRGPAGTAPGRRRRGGPVRIRPCGRGLPRRLTAQLGSYSPGLQAEGPRPMPSAFSSTIFWVKRRGWTARGTSRPCAGHTMSSTPSLPR
jgi:hypothetical protein